MEKGMIECVPLSFSMCVHMYTSLWVRYYFSLNHVWTGSHVRVCVGM